jgi:predicted ATPase/DNA-binding XRE family transcriptional regulator
MQASGDLAASVRTNPAGPDAPFGARLKQLRKALDLTQEALAEEVGCATQTIRKIEGGERRPSKQMAERLAQVLDVPPEDRAAFLHAARLVAEAAPQEQPAPPDLELARPAHLPAPATLFIGRDEELALIARLLANPACRLVTLTGPGGIGKTRLAIEAGRRAGLLREAAFVPLAPVADASAIVPAIAAALGFKFHGTGDITTQLLHYLRNRENLLILDNMEHLLDGADVLARIVEQAPGIKLLVTSRERLRLQGEWIVEVGGLPVASDDLGQGAAVTLFWERAERVRRGILADARLGDVVARICRMVEGMPLGIELAAAWAHLLPIEEIADEIARNLDFLRTTTRDLPERHRSLRAVFDYSWDRLEPAEQAALCKLSVFRGGFTRAAATEVAGASLAALAALVDKSLLRRHAQPDGTGRYELHEIVRQFAATKLDQHEWMQVEAGHAHYYAAFLEQCAPALRGADQCRTLARLEAEIDNLRLAWDWAIGHDACELIYRAASGMEWFYDLRDWRQEGVRAFERAATALRRPEEKAATSATGNEDLRSRALARALGRRASLLVNLGEFAAAQASLDECLALLRAHPDPDTEADALMCRAIAHYMRGDYSLSRQEVAQSLALSRRIGYRWNTAMGLSWLGLIDHAQGDYAAAHRWFHQSLEIWRVVGDQRGLGFCLSYGSMTAQELGSYAEAQTLLQESLAVNSAIGHRLGAGSALNHLGRLAHVQGDYLEAHYLFRESVDLFREIGDRWSMARALTYLGNTLQTLGRHEEAREALLQALRLAVEARAMPVALDIMVGLVPLLVRDGAALQAQELLDHVLHNAASGKETRDVARRLDAALFVPAELERGNVNAPPENMRSFEQLTRELLEQQ